jgi:aminotransferase
MDRLLLLHAAEVAAVPTFVQSACVEALNTDVAPMREEYRARRDYVTGRLNAMGLSFPEPEGAFYIFVDISRFGLPGEVFCERMIREAGVAAVPGSCFGAEGFIRLSYCCSKADLERGMERIEKFISRL